MRTLSFVHVNAPALTIVFYLVVGAVGVFMVTVPREIAVDPQTNAVVEADDDRSVTHNVN